MAHVTNKFLQDLLEFSEESMDWCAKESELATAKVGDIISMVMDNAERVSHVSESAIRAIESMKEVVNKLGPNGDRDAANELAFVLSEGSKQDEEISKFIGPIIETLQFQDRITQNMQNLSRVMRVWSDFRQTLTGKDQLSKDDLTEFGSELMACTTMKEERDIIHFYIDGLEQEEDTPRGAIFF